MQAELVLESVFSTVPAASGYQDRLTLYAVLCHITSSGLYMQVIPKLHVAV